MRKKTLLGASFAFVVFVALVSSGLIYCQMQEMQEIKGIEERHEVSSTRQEREIKMQNTAPVNAEELRLQEEREARERERERAREKEEKRAEEIEEASRGLDVDERGGVRVYTPKREAMKGLYIVPILIDGRRMDLRFDIVYRYSIDDGTGLAWIHGTSFTMVADGESHTWSIEPSRRHDNIARNAESLEERYQVSCTEEERVFLERVAHADSVTLYYQGEGERAIEMGRREQEELGQILTLATLLEEGD